MIKAVIMHKTEVIGSQTALKRAAKRPHVSTLADGSAKRPNASRLSPEPGM